jgi:hypothetical protein
MWTLWRFWFQRMYPLKTIAADIRNWSFQTSGSSVLGRVIGSLPPVGILDGHRENGAMISGVFAEAQRPGKAIYATASDTDGVLIGWTPPPTMPGQALQPQS